MEGLWKRKHERDNMDNDMEMISAEEFFGEIEEADQCIPNGNTRKSKKKAKTSAQNSFARIKVKMVMRIYGVSRARALEIIAGRAAERQEIERARAKAQSGGKSGLAAAPEFVPMEDLFN